MAIYMLTGLSIFLCIIIALMSVMHYFERKDLYDRIMSRNLTEYKDGGSKHITPAHEEVLKRWRSKGGDSK